MPATSSLVPPSSRPENKNANPEAGVVCFDVFRSDGGEGIKKCDQVPDLRRISVGRISEMPPKLPPEVAGFTAAQGDGGGRMRGLGAGLRGVRDRVKKYRACCPHPGSEACAPLQDAA